MSNMSTDKTEQITKRAVYQSIKQIRVVKFSDP